MPAVCQGYVQIYMIMHCRGRTNIIHKYRRHANSTSDRSTDGAWLNWLRLVEDVH